MYSKQSSNSKQQLYTAGLQLRRGDIKIKSTANL